MNISNPFNNNTMPAPAPSVRFGGATLGTATRGADRVFGWVGANRTREMLVEDFVGFGFLRTALDLLRGVFYGSGGLNVIAGLERLGREASSIFTDNILSGISASAIGKRLDKRWNAYSGGWSDYPTLALFRELAEKNPDEQAFLGALARKIAPAQSDDALKALRLVWRQPELPAKRQDLIATGLARRLGQDQLDVKIGNEIFRLDNLLDDTRLLSRQMRDLGGRFPERNWQSLAKQTLQATLKVKNVKLACIGLGLAATFTVPFVINKITDQFFGIGYYPGDIGLEGQFQPRKNPPDKPMPVLFANSRVYGGFLAARTSGHETADKKPNYVRDSLKNGNKWPLIGALAPLYFALGLFDTVNRRPLNPFSRNYKGTLKKLFDYSKSWPFTTQQQMAAMFALLITSRLLCSRSDNEYRERLVDSGLGWGVWILATPFIKKLVAQWSDRVQGTRLMKEVDGKPVLRTRAEIEKLLPYAKGVSQDVVEKTLKRNIWIGAGSTLATMALLGIVEPLIGIWWSKRNAEQKAVAATTTQQ